MNNFVFFGTPRFAEIFLREAIQKGALPSLVVTNPDKPAGRKKIVTPPPVKILAEKHSIPTFQPEKLEAESLRLKVSAMGGYASGGKSCAFAVVAAYGSIIPKSVIEVFPKGIMCIHPSLLPELRGATPIQTALLEGRRQTGVSIFLMDERVDHGPVLGEKVTAINGDDDYLSLEEKLAMLGAELFIETMPKYISGELSLVAQDESKATHTKKFSRESAFITEAELKSALEGHDAETVSNKIKAFCAEPGAWTIQNGKQIKLLSCKVENGKLKLTKIQTEGKKTTVL